MKDEPGTILLQEIGNDQEMGCYRGLFALKTTIAIIDDETNISLKCCFGSGR